MKKQFDLVSKTIEQLAITGVCCQWRGNDSYDSDVQLENSILRRKFSGEIATEQQPPNRYMKLAVRFLK